MIKNKYLLLGAIAGFIITLDQLTKLYIHTRFGLGESVEIIPGFFNITYVRNLGAAFGILHDSHETFRNLFFLLMPPTAAVIILLILRALPDQDILQTTALSLIFSGAIGNYVDRIRFGYVVDFFDFHLQSKYSWPAFNVADIAIVSGVGILMVLMIFEKKPKPTELATSAKGE